MLKDTFWIASDGAVMSMQRVFNEDLKPTLPLMSTNNVVEVVWPDGTWERYEIKQAESQSKIMAQH